MSANSGELAGRTAIVTGSSRGIGRAIAIRLAQEGARVVLCARDRDALLEVAAGIEREGGRPPVVAALDLRAADAAARVVEAAGDADILVNNAGATKRGDFLALSEEEWADGFALKFFGAVRLTRCAWPGLRRRQGAVVNIAGAGGRTPGAQFSIGGSVNAALLSFTKALAELGIQDGVRVNAINPGSVRTDRLARRLAAFASEAEFVRASRISRIGEPEDVAELVALLAGPRGRFFQGSLIDLDGGETKTM